MPLEILPFLVPLILIELGLVIFALVDLFKAERRVKGGNKLIWALVILFVSTIGPLVYLIAGREEV
ncbi:MAG: PLD nuclease N-terminal domain-containing protein [Chloroflexota bacterium]|nr:PLDc_N domain-containing protein [Chloroflexota bacterium]